ncbi:hypothetical protein KSP40_PGU003943 [Platanthera guangdongensis]|uniref:Uncharacterized protein n=1 Tax=Platanthera guangdongensis TaxID=2320717 RepID=A0ABR2N5Z1_9ASPA
MHVMFNEVVASGDYAWAPNSRTDPSSPDNLMSEHDEDMENLSTPININEDSRDTVRSYESGGCSQGIKRKRFEKNKHSGIKKNRLGTYNIDQLIESTIKVGESISQPPKISEPTYTIHEAIDELERHPDICSDPALYDFATIFLLDNKNRELFLSLPSSKKVWWLKNRQYTCMHPGGL